MSRSYWIPKAALLATLLCGCGGDSDGGRFNYVPIQPDPTASPTVTPDVDTTAPTLNLALSRSLRSDRPVFAAATTVADPGYSVFSGATLRLELSGNARWEDPAGTDPAQVTVTHTDTVLEARFGAAATPAQVTAFLREQVRVNSAPGAQFGDLITVSGQVTDGAGLSGQGRDFAQTGNTGALVLTVDGATVTDESGGSTSASDSWTAIQSAIDQIAAGTDTQGSVIVLRAGTYARGSGQPALLVGKPIGLEGLALEGPNPGLSAAASQGLRRNGEAAVVRRAEAVVDFADQGATQAGLVLGSLHVRLDGLSFRFGDDDGAISLIGSGQRILNCFFQGSNNTPSALFQANDLGEGDWIQGNVVDTFGVSTIVARDNSRFQGNIFRNTSAALGIFNGTGLIVENNGFAFADRTEGTHIYSVSQGEIGSLAGNDFLGSDGTTRFDIGKDGPGMVLNVLAQSGNFSLNHTGLVQGANPANFSGSTDTVAEPNFPEFSLR